jgi:hypothetical protein
MIHHSFMIVEATPIERVAMVSRFSGTESQETEVLLAGAQELSAIVTMSGFAGLQINGQILNDSGELVSEASTRFTDEDQGRIVLHWGSVNWLPGQYTAMITSEVGSNRSCELL